jgi:5-methylthioribose kinase
MREIDAETAADYLRQTGRVPAGRAIAVRALGWGVSNIVLRVEVAGQAPLVLKQSRERLRTEALWVSRLERIWTERDALKLLATILPHGTVPEVVFEDEANYLIAMTCAPDDAAVWKERLLAGQTDWRVAHRAGEILGTIHAETVNHPALTGRLADTPLFDELRIDPFYRTVARVHRDLKPRLDALIASMPTAPEQTFVHADFSPKNILIHSAGLTLVDFETAHAGDPAFDLGFFLSHLVLKAFRATPELTRTHPDPALLVRPHPTLPHPLGSSWADYLQQSGLQPYEALIQAFWAAYLNRTGPQRDGDRVARATLHAAACALARVDGKSKVDYLDDPAQEAVRQFARTLLLKNS